MTTTRFVQEILELPDIIQALLEYYAEGQEGAELLNRVAAQMRSHQSIIFTGMGASLYASDAVLWELALNCPVVESRDASELLHFGLRGIRSDALIVAVSQSGESVETKAVVHELREQNSIIALVNNMDSSMARESGIACPMCAGKETSISVKTFTNTLVLLYLISTAVQRGDMTAVRQELAALAISLREQLRTMPETALEAFRYFEHAQHFHVTARGSDMAAARQGALTLNEGAGIFTNALTAAAFRHGPIELAGPGHSVIGICSKNNRPDLTSGFLAELASFGSRVLCLADSNAGNNGDVARVVLQCSNSRYFSVLCVPFMALFTHHAAPSRGREAGVFRHGTKITIKE